MGYKSKEKWNEWNRNRHKQNKEELVKLKSNPCVDCSGIFPHYIMEFDHVPERGPKKANIGTLSGSRKMTAKSIKEELQKCDLVCANCHKIRTFKRNNKVNPEE